MKWCLSVLVLTFSLCTSVTAGWTQTSTTDALRTMQQVLRAVYPDLADKAHAAITTNAPFSSDWTTSSPDRPFSIEIELGNSLRHPTDSASERADPYLSGVFTIRDDFVESARFSGRRVHSQEMAGLLAQSEAHPEWKVDDLDRTLKTLGAKYPSTEKDKFFSTLSIAALHEAFGIVRNQEVTFWWRQDTGSSSGGGAVMPRWTLSLETDDSHGRLMCYVLFFEPINGSFTGMIGNRCDGR